MIATPFHGMMGRVCSDCFEKEVSQEKPAVHSHLFPKNPGEVCVRVVSSIQECSWTLRLNTVTDNYLVQNVLACVLNILLEDVVEGMLILQGRG